MIPHRMLSNEIGSNGLRERVTACRKRLRVSRVTHKQPHALNEASELFPEVVPESQLRAGSHSEPARNELNENEASRLTGRSTEGQEVGIT
jgi:hypothetical protein